jgi:FtsP/CotA-like multicopper oxidase with cupredoxin domain
MRFQIRGRVVDQFTAEGIGGVRVEAWDKDFILDDYLGSASTITDGSFEIGFDDSAFQEFFVDRWPDLYFKVYCYNELLVSTEDSVLWNVATPRVGVEIRAPHPAPPSCDERHLYLKIERIEHYSPVRPEEKVVPPVQYGRDCMRGDGHENGLIPQSEIDARSLTAVVYREYLDAGYLIPKPDKLIAADVNEPGYAHRVPGTVIYTRPCERLKIHVWNTDEVPHSLHAHGVRYGIDSDGSWPFGTEAAHHGGRSDAICPGDTWTYTFDVPDDAIGAWPFHDHTHHHHTKIDQGLFGGIVVLGPCDRPPRRFTFPWAVLEPVYRDIERLEGRRAPMAGHPPKDGDEGAAPDHRAPPPVHVRQLKPQTRELLKQHLDFLDELVHRERLLPRRVVNTDHVPVFFHVMSNPEARPVFDSGDIEELGGTAELDFPVAGDFPYFCRHHPEMTGTVHVLPGGPDPVMVTIDPGPPMAFSPADITVGVGGTITWLNNTASHHTVTSTEGASMATHCINGRGFVGNTPTIVARSGQRIRWYVFNLDTSPTWHNFHPHAMRWKFGGESLDIRSMGPAESFVVESEVPPVLLLTEEEEKAQSPEHRPEGAKLYRLKGDFVFHCHVHHHMMNGMVGLVRARQSLWLTEDMAHEIGHRTGLPLDDGSNACPDVDHHPCGGHAGGHWQEVAGAPEVAFMHSVLLPGTERVLYWGYTRADQSRVWDYSTPAGTYLPPANQPADAPGLTVNTSDMWSAAHALLDTAEGHVLVNGGFSPDKAFTFDPGTLTWTRVGDTAGNRFYATTMTLADGRVATLYGNVKTVEIFTHGAGWGAPIAMPAFMNHHQYYPWTWELPDGRLFLAGPHDPANRLDLAAPAAAESFPTLHGNRSTGGEKGTAVLLILRPPDYDPVVYIIGGNTPATEKTAEMIDLSAPAPAWSALPDLNVARPQQFTATLLPDGRVLVAGGVTGGPDGGPCELLDPSNLGAGWALGPAMKYVRTYHSSFVLLADGSVLGGGDPMAAGVPTPHERYFPGYFAGARPTITAAPAIINYGAAFAITTPDAADLAEVVLLRAGATTHGYNMSQRGIELVIAAVGAATVDVEAPPNAGVAPPGWYLLFVLNASRAPSEGRWVRLTP